MLFKYLFRITKLFLNGRSARSDIVASRTNYTPLLIQKIKNASTTPPHPILTSNFSIIYSGDTSLNTHSCCNCINDILIPSQFFGLRCRTDRTDSLLPSCLYLCYYAPASALPPSFLSGWNHRRMLAPQVQGFFFLIRYFTFFSRWIIFIPGCTLFFFLFLMD